MARKKLHVFGLSPEVTEDELRTVFEACGKVEDVFIVKGKPFGFVTFETFEGAKKAIDDLNGFDLKGRYLQVSVAKSKKQKEDKWGSDKKDWGNDWGKDKSWNKDNDWSKDKKRLGQRQEGLGQRQWLEQKQGLGQRLEEGR